jgi:hypothetical protein
MSTLSVPYVILASPVEKGGAPLSSRGLTNQRLRIVLWFCSRLERPHNSLSYILRERPRLSRKERFRRNQWMPGGGKEGIDLTEKVPETIIFVGFSLGEGGCSTGPAIVLAFSWAPSTSRATVEQWYAAASSFASARSTDVSIQSFEAWSFRTVPPPVGAASRVFRKFSAELYTSLLVTLVSLAQSRSDHSFAALQNMNTRGGRSIGAVRRRRSFKPFLSASSVSPKILRVEPVRVQASQSPA